MDYKKKKKKAWDCMISNYWGGIQLSSCFVGLWYKNNS